ncbi:PQQ-binding-like beta-propeller repeat protein [Mycobacterium sp. NPDC049093]
MNPWGSSPWGDNDGQQAPGMSGSPFDTPAVQPGAPPVFGAAPGFPTTPASQGWGQQPPYGGYPHQFSPQPPEDRRGRGKVIGIVVAAVVVVLALVGSVVYWMSGSDSGLSEADTAAGKAEIAGVERPPTAVKLPSLGAAPGVPLWSYPLGGGSPRGLTRVVGGDTKTVLVNLNDSFTALDAGNGSQKWLKPGVFTNCVFSTSGATALCVAADKSAALLDVATGATKNVAPNQGGGLPRTYSGSGLLAYSSHQQSLTVFDDSGQQLWTKPMPGQTSVFLDQGVVAEQERGGLSTKFYDAKTGSELFSIGAVDSVIATSRGIAVSQRSGPIMRSGLPRQRIDFYSFTGKLAWRIPEDRGYRLPGATPIFSFNGSVPYTMSGVTSPIVYSEEKREIAGVDPLTGELTWSQQIPMTSDTLVSLEGVGGLCVLSYSEVGTRAGGVRVRGCNDGTGAFVDRAEISGFIIATDGKQIVGSGDGPVSAYDTATGQRTWQFPDDVHIVTWAGDGLYIEGYDDLKRVS